MVRLLHDQPVRVRGVVVALLVLVAGGCAAQLLQVVTGVGGPKATHVMIAWVENVVLVCSALVILVRALTERRERRAWWVLGLGVMSWAFGSVTFYLFLEDVETAPYPSFADALWLGVYPAAYCGLLLLLRGRVARSFHASVWLDGLIGALTVGAFGAALVLPPIVAAASGSTAAIATNIAYPSLDFLLIAFLLGIFALCGWRPGRALLLLAGGLVLLAGLDSTYLWMIATGTYREGTLLDGGYASAFLLVALSAWLVALSAWQRPAEEELRLEGWTVLVVPACFTAAAIGLLVYDHFEHINLVAFVVAISALLLTLARLGLTFREVRALSGSRRMALTDELTQLGNRRALHEGLGGALVEAGSSGEQLAVLLLDLDRFKQLNDALGHRYGDLLLVELAARMARALPARATLTRLGGDEFAVVLRDAGDATDVAPVARTVCQTVQRPFTLDGMAVQVEGSVGVALHPQDGASVDELLQRADVAMYLAKERRTGVEFYSAALDENTRENYALAGELRQALRDGALMLHYQPKLELRCGSVLAAEALVRWQHPVRGLLEPDDFIAVAEQTGQMPALTSFVLRTALAQAAAWSALGHDLGVAVNVSTADLLDEHLEREVRAALEETGVEPSRVTLEITEHTLMTDPQRAAAVVEGLRSLGLSVAIDDYGTGYSSLTYLRVFPATELKIDRAFVSAMDGDPAAALIVASTIGLAHGLGLRVVAEGVEDRRTQELLTDMGCDALQGFALSRPLPADSLTAWMQRRRPERVIEGTTVGG